MRALLTVTLTALWVVLEGAMALDIICQVQLHHPIGVRMAEQLCHCTTFIVGSSLFDIGKSTVLTNEELSRISAMKRCNPQADILLTIALPFEVSVTTMAHRNLSDRISIALRDNGLDGVDLDYDVALLDQSGQLRYGQFLRKLRTLLGEKYVISTTIGCHSLSPGNTLLATINDQLDIVSVIGVDKPSDQVATTELSAEFRLRDYSTEPIHQLVRQGLSIEKIVLSVLTVGVVFDPRNYRTTRSLQRSRVGVLSYGQVCELLTDRAAKCGGQAFVPPTKLRPTTCSLFGGNGAIVYDNEDTVRRRTVQAQDLHAKGVLLLLNYDDAENVCDKGSFPLFRALRQTVVDGRVVHNLDRRFGDTQDRAVYYTYHDGRFLQNRCAPGEEFNGQLAICIRPTAAIASLAAEVRASDAKNPSSSEKPQSVNLPTVSKETLLSALGAEPSLPIETNIGERLVSTLRSALTYLDGIVERAVSLVRRLEYLEDLYFNRVTDAGTGSFKTSQGPDGSTVEPSQSIVSEADPPGESSAGHETVDRTEMESSLVPELLRFLW